MKFTGFYAGVYLVSSVDYIQPVPEKNILKTPQYRKSLGN